MLSTKDIGRTIVITYCNKCNQPFCVCKSKVRIVFELWVKLNQEERIEFSNKMLSHLKDNVYKY